MKHALTKLQESGFHRLPTIEDVENATLENPYFWDLSSLERPVGQPEPSHEEQKCTVQKATVLFLGVDFGVM